MLIAKIARLNQSTRIEKSILGVLHGLESWDILPSVRAGLVRDVVTILRKGHEAMKRKMIGLRIGVLALALAVAPGAAALAASDRDDHRSGDSRDKDDRDDHGKKDRDDRDDDDRPQLICHGGATVTVDKKSVPHHIIHGDRVGSCPASPSR